MEVEKWLLAQIPLMLAVLGFFGSKITESIFKRKEVRVTLFEQEKIQAINNFFKCYADCINMFNSIINEDITQKTLNTKEFDRLTTPLYNNLRGAYYNLSLFLTVAELPNFKEVRDSIFQISKKLTSYYYNSGPEIDLKTNERNRDEYWKQYLAIRKVNDGLLAAIGKEFRGRYYQKI